MPSRLPPPHGRRSGYGPALSYQLETARPKLNIFESYNQD